MSEGKDSLRDKAGRAQRKRVGEKRRRVRPAARAARRQAKASQNPVPPPPSRRPAAAPRPAAKANVRAATPELQQQWDRIQHDYTELEGKAQLASLYTDIGNIDAALVSLPNKLDTLRERGYVHSGQLEDLLEDVDDRWDEIRPRLERTLRTQVAQLDRSLDVAERQILGLTVLNARTLAGAETAVSSLSNQIDEASRAAAGLYYGLDGELNHIEHQIRQVEKMLERIDQSAEIQLRNTEAPLACVKAEWQPNGEDGPDGYLFLTDQRLLFEQREEIVTKRVLGLFKKDSEKIQKLLLDIEVADVEEINHKEEGGFLGMGKDDILELVFTAKAPVSRARFHLDGQDSEDWAALIKRALTGEIDADRADEYEEEVAAAEALVLTFPKMCPNCFAALETPPRGVTAVTCEFCSTVISPETNEG